MTVTLRVKFVLLYHIYRTIIDCSEESLNQKAVYGAWWVMRDYMVLEAVPYIGISALTRHLGS